MRKSNVRHSSATKSRRSAPPRPFIRIGPGGGGGQIRPTISPHDPRMLFIVCDMTGWFQTANAGESWRQINLKGVVRSCGFDPADRRVIYAGNSGLYRSADAGKTWALVFPDPAKLLAEVEAHDHADHRYIAADNWPGGRILGIAVDPADSASICLAIYGGGEAGEAAAAPYTPGQLAIFASSDYGKSFAHVTDIGGIDPGGAVGDNHAVKAICIEPASPAKARTLLLVAPNGVHHVGLAEGKVASMPLPEGVQAVDQAAISHDRKSRRGVIYITAPGRWGQAGQYVGGVYRSDDGGQSWRQCNKGLLAGVHEPGHGRAPQFNCIASAADDAKIAYVECRCHPEKRDEAAVWGHPFGVLKTTDGGASWKWVLRQAWDERDLNMNPDGWLPRWNGPGAGGTAIHLGVAPSDANVVWRVTAMNSMTSADGGRSWRETYCTWRPDGAVTTNGMDVTTCYGVHFDPHVKARRFISYTDISLFRTDDADAGWWLAKGGIPNAWRNTCYWLVSDPAVRDRLWSVWSGTHDLPRPKMFGGDWSNKSGGVAFSGDGGKSWHPVTTGMPDNAVPTHILLDGDSPAGMRRLYVASFNQGVYRSQNDGRSWTLANNGIDPANLYAWRLAQAADGTLWLCVARGGKDEGPHVDGAVYKSSDRAQSWQKVTMPAGTNAPNDIAIDPRDPRRLYLACWPRTVADELPLVAQISPQAGAARPPGKLAGKAQAGPLAVWPGGRLFSQQGFECITGPRPVGGGLWSSQDGGASWKLLLDDRLYCYGVTIDPARPDRLYVTGFNSSIFRSDDRGSSWRRLGGYNFKWGHRVIPDPYEPKMIYVTTFGGSVFHGPADGTGAELEDILDLARSV